MIYFHCRLEWMLKFRWCRLGNVPIPLLFIPIICDVGNFVLPKCGGEYADFDLMYLSEIDQLGTMICSQFSQKHLYLQIQLQKRGVLRLCRNYSRRCSRIHIWLRLRQVSIYGNVYHGESGPRVTSLDTTCTCEFAPGLARKTIRKMHVNRVFIVSKIQYKLSMLHPWLS